MPGETVTHERLNRVEAALLFLAYLTGKSADRQVEKILYPSPPCTAEPPTDRPALRLIEGGRAGSHETGCSRVATLTPATTRGEGS